MTNDTTVYAAWASLGVAVAALIVMLYTIRLMNSTERVLVEVRGVMMEVQGVLLGQQFITIAQARAIDGLRAGVQRPTFSGGLIGGSFDENLVQLFQAAKVQPVIIQGEGVKMTDSETMGKPQAVELSNKKTEPKVAPIVRDSVKHSEPTIDIDRELKDV